MICCMFSVDKSKCVGLIETNRRKSDKGRSYLLLQKLFEDVGGDPSAELPCAASSSPCPIVYEKGGGK